MFDLKCKRMNCKFNKNCNCEANKIDVASSTRCTTYVDSGLKKVQNDKIEQKPTRKNTSVKCEANCIFNDKCVCKANSISVMTNDFQPECCTFVPK